MLPFLDAFIKLIIAFHQGHAHPEIGDTLFRIVFGDTFQKTVNGFRTYHQLVLFIGSCDSKLHSFLCMVCCFKYLPRLARSLGQKCPDIPGKSTHSLGHSYSCTRAFILMYTGTDAHVHGYECSCSWVHFFHDSRLLIVNLFCISVESHIGVSMSLAPLQDVLLLYGNETNLS